MRGDRAPADAAEAAALAAGYLHNVDDSILACRGQGHAWPKLRAGRGVPRGMHLEPRPDGCWQIVSTCRDCGTERTLTTTPGGVIDHPARYQYRQPEGYKAPKGAAVTRRDCLDESWRRMREQQEHRRRLEPAEAAAEGFAAPPGPPPPVTFAPPAG